MGNVLALIVAMLLIGGYIGILILCPLSHSTRRVVKLGEVNAVDSDVEPMQKLATPDDKDTATSSADRIAAEELSNAAEISNGQNLRVKRDVYIPANDPWFRFWEALGLRRYGYGTYY